MKRDCNPNVPNHWIRPWNQKNLDYEIETSFVEDLRREDTRLEIKRTSITRLKRNNKSIFSNNILTWNQKNLDYEIETFRLWVVRCRRWAWNQKNLDYEIET